VDPERRRGVVKTRGVLTLAVVLLAGASVAWAQSLVRVDKVSNSGFDKTAKQLETALKSRGMMVVATIDHQNMMKMVGGSIRGSKTLEFGKPDMLKMVMPSDPAAGLEMPHKIYVYERGDGVGVVSYYKPSGGFSAYGKDQLKMVGEMMDKMFEEIVTDATK
jgi:uncharacterized protein (DUF302 family)